MQTWPAIRAVRCAMLFAYALSLWGCTTAAPRMDQMEAAGPPPRPRAIVASDLGLREVTISWEVLEDDTYAYRIERSTSPHGPFEVAGYAPYEEGEYVDRGSKEHPLWDNTWYYYRAVAVRSSGAASRPSRVVESVTAKAPSPPTGLVLSTPSSRAVALSWRESPSVGIAGYVVKRVRADDPKTIHQVGETNALHYLDGGVAGTDLDDSTTYLYAVAAVNRVGAVSKLSEWASATTLPPPAPVQGLSAEQRHVRCVPLSWQAHPDNDIVGYEIHRSDSAESDFVKHVDLAGRETTRYLDGGGNPGNLEDDHAYYYRVRAVNEVGALSSFSEIAVAMTRPVPPVVDGLAATSFLPHEVPLSWEVSGDDRVVGYVIARAQADESEFEEIAELSERATTSFIDRGQKRKPLSDGATYRYRVCAFNTARARSPWSDVVEATTKFPPEPPIDVWATTNLPKKIAVSWEASFEPDVTTYIVESSSNGKRYGRLARVAAPGTFAEDGGLKDAAQRYYRVRAVDADGLESAWSEAVSGRSKACPAPPSGLSFHNEQDSFRLAWSSPLQPDIVSYNVWQKKLFSAKRLGGSETTSYTVDAETVGERISIQISAVDADGLESERSEVLEIVP